MLVFSDKKVYDNIQNNTNYPFILNENLQEAAYYLSDVKKINPNNASVGWNEARLNLKMQNVKTALEVARETNYLFPEDVEGIGILGACLRANNMFEESIVFLNKAIQLDPNYAEALINRALVRLHNEDEVGALKDLDMYLISVRILNK